jgi:subtilisin
MGLLKKIKRALFGSNWGPEFVTLPDSWRASGGSGVRVLVIDTGAPRRCPAAPYVTCASSFVWGEGAWDENGHGTAVCSIIHDWAPRADIISYKALDRDGHLEGCTNVLTALRTAINLKPHIVNLSLAAYVGASKLRDPIRELVAGGALVIAGVGNDPAKGMAYPARFDEVVSVGAIDNTGEVADFSLPIADLFMPGVDIRCPWKNGEYRLASGTSLAAAAASGLAALAMSAGLDTSTVSMMFTSGIHGRPDRQCHSRDV